MPTWPAASPPNAPSGCSPNTAQTRSPPTCQMGQTPHRSCTPTALRPSSSPRGRATPSARSSSTNDSPTCPPRPPLEPRPESSPPAHPQPGLRARPTLQAAPVSTRRPPPGRCAPPQPRGTTTRPEQQRVTWLASPRSEHASRRSRFNPTRRWTRLADEIDPRLTGQSDWPALAEMLQVADAAGHDVTDASPDDWSPTRRSGTCPPKTSATGSSPNCQNRPYSPRRTRPGTSAEALQRPAGTARPRSPVASTRATPRVHRR